MISVLALLALIPGVKPGEARLNLFRLLGFGGLGFYRGFGVWAWEKCSIEATAQERYIVNPGMLKEVSS